MAEAQNIPFVGGPIDGQWRGISDDRRLMPFEVLDPRRLEDYRSFANNDPMQINTHTYLPCDLPIDGDNIKFFVHESLSRRDAILMVFNSYRGKVAQWHEW